MQHLSVKSQSRQEMLPSIKILTRKYALFGGHIIYKKNLILVLLQILQQWYLVCGESSLHLIGPYFFFVEGFSVDFFLIGRPFSYIMISILHIYL